MGETFQGINGNFNGYALENSDFDPQSDDSDVDSFFGGMESESNDLNPKQIRKGRKRFQKRQQEPNAFGGF